MKCRKKKSYWQQDIRIYEYLKAILQGIFVIGVVSYLFYGTWMCTILFSPYLIRYIKSWEKQVIKQRQERFRIQFKEAIQSLSTALNVGYSLENAMREVVRDLKGIYKREDVILKEFGFMIQQLHMNVPAEVALNEFATRTEDEDVQTFATVFAMAKKSGGDAMEIIRSVVRQLGDKMDVEREIQTMIAAKKMELRVMTIIPLAMVSYLKISFPEFLHVLYGNVAGVAIMSICLGIYLISYEAGRRMVEIEV